MADFVALDLIWSVRRSWSCRFFEGMVWGMGDSDVREHEARPRGAAGGLVFDLVASKLRRPMVRRGTVDRSVLIERLRRDDRRPIVSVVAPPGYGKTTVLAQWAERNGQSFAWVSVDERDNDPKVLLTYVAEALNRVEPIDERVFDALASPGSSVPGSVVPRLGSAFSSMTSPVALVLDDVHILRNRECQAALSVLADHVPGGSQLAVAGREPPPLRVARLRAEGRILEIGPGDLSLDRDEASMLLRNADIAVSEDDVRELHRRTEGWPTGLYLAALYLREGGPFAGAAVSFGGDDRLVSEYMESEFLARISHRHREFLTRTAVLERMCGPLCDAVLELSGSAATLAELERSNLLLVPLDRRGQWYRYHHLFRDMLLAELDRLEPSVMPLLQRRAAQWHERNGQPAEALGYWMRAGEADSASRLVGSLAFPAYQQGRVATAEQWFGWLEDHGAPANQPAVAVLAAMVAALTGKPGEAERWAEAAERGAAVASLPDGSLSIEPWLALLRALLCRDGAEQMRADAELAAKTMAAGSFWRTAATVFLALAHLMAGDPARADVLFEDTAAGGRAGGANIGACVALAERSLLAIAAGAWEAGERYLSEAWSLVREANLEDYPPVTLLYAVAARIALHQGDRPRARAELTRAQRLRPALTYALPHLAVQARIELARCHLALSDFAAAQLLLREVAEVLTRRPGLGVFAGQAKDLQVELSRIRGSRTPGASALTAAELRLLPMLATHLSFREIAEQIFLSPNTVKSQAMSIYHKLGASSRNQAVTRSRELGLLEG
jgi:LuxR family transcriptional regulator, maltose regulon positive regulatory protein